MSIRLLSSLCVVVALVGCDVVAPSNPFDPETPIDQQARATINGVIVLEDPFEGSARSAPLARLQVGLIDESGRAVDDADPDTDRLLRPLQEIDVGADGGADVARGQGRFTFPELPPGTYTIDIVNAPDSYRAPTLPTLRVLPGSTADVGALVYRYEAADAAGPGVISGDVRAEGGSAGQHRVALFQRKANGVVVEIDAVVTSGAFRFEGLGFGTFAVVAESEGFTPVYRLDIDITANEGEQAHQFAGVDALVVHPLTAALSPVAGDPSVVFDEGGIYVRGDELPLLVLPFSTNVREEIGVTTMRLSTSSTFLDAAGAPLPFVPHLAQSSVALPAADGAVRVFAQFEARSADNAFAFTSPTVTLDVVKDTVAPAFVEVVPLNLQSDGAGGFLSRSRTIDVRVDVNDATSAVDAVGVAIGAAPTELLDGTGTPGLQRLQRSVTADVDGALELFVLADDRAGNRSDVARVGVLVDTVAPSIAVDVIGAAGGLARSRLLRLDVSSLIAGDDDLLVAVGVEGAVDESALLPLGEQELLLPANLVHGAAVVVSAVAFDIVGNRTVVDRTLTLDLRGTVSGRIVSDGVPSIVDSVAGGTVALVNGTTTIATQTLDATGGFIFADVAEGRGYAVRAELAGHTTTNQRNIAVVVDDVVDVGDITASLLRGDVSGTALLSDRAGDATAHAGIAVSLTLTSATRRFSTTTVTTADGRFVFRAVPQTIGSERLVLSASATDYGSAASTTALTTANVDVGTLSLPRARGDFDVCRTGDPACTPAQFFSATSVDIKLRDATDVVTVHVGLNGGAAVPLPLGVGNRTTVNLGTSVDGEIELAVQAERADGTRSEVLTSSITKDTVAPASVTLSRRASPLARDPRFTAADFVDVVVEADAGSGAVAPLAPARAVVVDTAPASAPSTGFVSCTHDAACRVPLPTLERLHRVFVFSCDAAGNCAAPQQTFVIRDVTPPTTANGADFTIVASGSIVDGASTILPSRSYGGAVATGRARTAGGVNVVDDSGAAVAEVFAFRFALASEAVANGPLQDFSEAPLANQVRSGADIVVPALAVGDTDRTVFAQFVDAAGNVASALVSRRLLVDDAGPVAVVVINNNLPTRDPTVPFTVTVPVGAEAPVRVELIVDVAAPQSFVLPVVGGTLNVGLTEGTRRITINAIDRVGNATRSDQLLVVDRTAPAVAGFRCSTCADSGIGELTSNAVDGRVDLVVSASDALTGVSSVVVAFASGGAPQTRPVLAGGVVSGVQLPLNTATSITLIAVDAVGNESAVFTRPLRHDTTAPVIAGVAIEANAARTNKRQVAVAIDVPAGDAVTMRLSASASFTGPAATFRSDDFFVFAGADGERQVCVEVADSAGNTSSRCDTITLDLTPPVGTVTLPVAATNAGSLTATLTFSPDTAKVAVSATTLSCDPATTPYVTAATTASVALAGADGERTIIACFLDGAGNVSQATTSVSVDRTPPTVSLALNNRATFATSTSVSAAFATSDSDVNGVNIAVDSTPACVATGAFGAFTPTTTVTLPATQGLHTVRACLRDRAGNLTTTEASITLDTLRPTATVVVNGGAEFTRQSAVTVTTTTNADVTSIALANADVDCATANYTAFSTTVTHQLAALDGIKTVSVCVKDAAGLTSLVATDSITVDTTVPAATIVAAGGAETSALATVSAVLSGVSADVRDVFVTASPIACDTAPFTPFVTSSFQVTLSLPNTDNVITACLRDGAGNIGAVTDRVFFENAAGDALIIAIDGGAATSNASNRQVLVSLFAPSTDFNQMKLAEAATIDCASLSGYVSFQATAALTLSAGTAPAEGQRTVAACVRSTSTGLTRLATDSILLDTFAPAGSVTIDGTVTSSPIVTAALTNAFATEVISFALSDTSTLSNGRCTGSFESFTGTRSFTFGGNDGTKSLFACLRDAAGNTTEVSDAIVLDRQAPSPVSIAVPALTASRDITVTLTVPADAAFVVVAEGALDCAAAQGYIAVPAGTPKTLPLSLTAVDGTRAIVACFKDAAGNTSQAAATTSLDTQLPSATVVLDSGAVFARSSTVSVALSNAIDVQRIARIESASAPNCATVPAGSFTAFASPATAVLSAGDGVKTVQMCLQDAAGNRALAVADSIIVDATSPNGSVSINAGALATASRSVTLTLGTNGNADVVAYAAAEGDTIACASANLAYAPFAAIVPFLLESSGTGLKRVSVCLKDDAGNTSTVTATDTIDLDTAGPAGATLTINDGDGFLNGEASIGVTVAWTGAGDVTRVKVGEGAADCGNDNGYVDTAANSTSTTVASVPVSVGDGTKLVVACLKDLAGNTATAQDTSVRDTTAPLVTSVVCADCLTDGGTLFSRSTTVALAVSSDEAGSGLASARVAVDAGAEAAATLTSGVVSVTGLAAGPRTVRVKLVDRAGNTSTTSKDLAVTIDQAAPTLTSLLLNGSNAVGNETASRVVAVSIVGASADTAAMAVLEGTGTTPTIANCALATYAPFVPEFSRTLPALDGDKVVTVCLKDRAGNTGTPVTTTIKVDTVPVSLGGTPVVILDGDGFLQAETTVNVRLSWTTNADARKAKVSEGLADCGSAAGYVDLPTNTNTFDVVGVAVGGGDGQKLVSACFKDAAGNIATGQDTTVRDATRPFGSISINGGASSTNQTTVTMTVTPASDDVVKIAFINTSTAPDCSAVAPGAFADLAFTMGHTLTIDGPVVVHACFKDAAGNVNILPVSATITKDTAAPAVTLALVGNAAAVAGQTNTRSVTAQVSTLTADANGIAIVEGAVTCASAAYETLPQPLTLPLTRAVLLADGSDGTRTVRICAKDAAGNFSSVSGTAATIVLDQSPPQVAVTLGGGAAFSTSSSTTVTLASTPANDQLKLVLSTDPAIDCALVPDSGSVAYSAAFTALPASVPGFALTSGQGEKFVVGCFKDRAGNIARFGDGIVVDSERPQASFRLDGGVSFSLDTTVIAEFAGVSTDITQMQVSRTAIADCAAGTYTAFVNNGNVTGLVEGSNTIFACLKDGAGNVTDNDITTAGSQPLAATIVVDTADPIVASFSVTNATVVTAGFVASTAVRVNLTSLPNDAIAVAVANTTINCATASYELLPQPLDATGFVRSHDLAAGADGTRSVAVCVKDAAGRTGTRTESVTLDTTPPSLSSFSLAAGAAQTRLTTVPLTMASSPVGDLVRSVLVPTTTPATVSCAQATYAGAFAAVPASRNVALPTVNGVVAVVGCFQDQAGNVTTAVDDIARDTVAPRALAPACVDCTVVEKVSFTNASDVEIEVERADVDVVSAFTIVTSDRVAPIGENRACVNTSTCRVAVGETCVAIPVDAAGTLANRCVQVQPDADQIVVDLATVTSAVPGTAAEGEQQIGVALVDTAGNISDVVFGRVVRDSIAPAITWVLREAPITNRQTVFVSALTVTNEVPLAGVDRLGTMQASSLSTFSDAATVVFRDTVTPFIHPDDLPVTLTAGDGAKTVFVQFTDNAGNVATTTLLQVPVALDTTEPTTPRFDNVSTLIGVGGSVVINALLTASSDINLRPTTPYDVSGLPRALDCRALGLVNTPTAGTCAWNGTTPFTLDGDSLDEGETRLRVRALDRASNVSADDLLVITRDATPPPEVRIGRVIPGDRRIGLSWSSPSLVDVAGFVVHYEVSNGGDCDEDLPYEGNIAAQGASGIDVGLNTSFELTDLANGIGFCIAVTSYDRAGNVSSLVPTRGNNPTDATPYELAPVVASVLSGPVLGLTTSDTIGAVATRGGYVYIAARNHGLIELDLTNEACFGITSAPTFATCAARRESTTGTAMVGPTAIVLHGAFAYVADNNATTGGVRVYRINEGALPVQQSYSPVATIGATSQRLARTLAVQDNILAVVNAVGVTLANISPVYAATSAAPTSLSTIAVSIDNIGVGVDLQGRLLAVGGLSGSQLFDISVPTAPTVVPTDCVPSGADVRSVRFAGSTLYMAQGDLVVSCDMSTGATGALVSTATSEAGPLVPIGPYLLSAGRGGFDVLDASARDQLEFLGRYTSKESGTRERGPVAVDGSRVYFASGSGTALHLVDLTQFRAVERISEEGSIRGAANAIVVDDALINGFADVSHLRRDGIEIDATSTGAPKVLVEENGTIVGLSASAAEFAKTSRDTTGGLAAPVTANVTGTLSMIGGVLRWPFLVTVSSEAGVGRLDSWDMRPFTASVPPTLISSVSLGAVTAADAARLVVHRGHVYAAVGTLITADRSGFGLHRATLNGQTGVLGAKETVVPTTNGGIVAITPIGNRLAFWSASAAINVQHLITTTTWVSGNITTLGVVGAAGGGSPAISVGKRLIIPGRNELKVIELTSSPTTSFVTAGQNRLSFALTLVQDGMLTGDRMYLSQDDRPLMTVRLR